MNSTPSKNALSFILLRLCLLVVALVMSSMATKADAVLADSDSRAVVVMVPAGKSKASDLLPFLSKDTMDMTASLRDVGFCVIEYEPEGCLAFNSTQTLSAAQMDDGKAPPVVLAANLLRLTTKEQLATREKGYILAKDLAPAQAHLLDLVLNDKALAATGARGSAGDLGVSLGMWCEWAALVARQTPAGIMCDRLRFGIRPPTEASVPEPPLLGPPLWWAWPCRTWHWDDSKRIEIPAAEYRIPALMDLVSKVAGVDIVVGDDNAQATVVASFHNSTLRAVLWTLEMATGLPVAFADNSTPPIITVGTRTRRDDGAGYNPLRAIPNVGYFSLTDTAAGGALVESLAWGEVTHKHSIAWRYGDLPLLYRRWVQDEWEETVRGYIAAEPSVHLSENDVVVWVKCGVVSPHISDGRASGATFYFPAL